MELPLKFTFFFFLLTSQMGLSETDFVEDAEPIGRFHIKETGETLKSEMDGYFWNLWQKMTKKNADTLLTLRRHQETLSANLSREFNENMQILYVNLTNSFNERQSSSDLKMESSLLNISETFTRKMSMSEAKIGRSLEVLSKTFDGKLQRSESKVMGRIATFNETLWRNHKPLSSSLTNMTALMNHNPWGTESTTILTAESQTEIISTPRPHVQTEVEEVNLMEGTIQFTGGANPVLRRKIWVFRSQRSIRMKFVMEKNALGDEARLSTWNSFQYDGGQHVWNGTQSDWREERESRGNLILVMWTTSPSAAKKSSFKLKFSTSIISHDSKYTTEILLGEGRRVVSFPPNSTEDYPTSSYFAVLIAPPSGRLTQLTLKYLNNQYKCDNGFSVFFLDESPSELPNKRRPWWVYRPCGNDGGISEPIGNATVAIIRFGSYSNRRNGNGFQIELAPI